MSKSPDKGTCKVCTLRRGTTQGLVVVGLTDEEISNVDIKCVKVTAARYIGQGQRVKNLPSQYIEEKHYARFGCCKPYI